jgi:hypothetical protein
LAELKQQILEEINEEELETCVGASGSYTKVDPRDFPVMQNTGVNQNTGVSLHSGVSQTYQNTGVRRPRI